MNKLTILACMAFLSVARFAEVTHENGMTLCVLQNLPHRGLGMLYWANTLQPQRDDWARDYLTMWLVATAEKRVQEGQTRPVLAMYAAQLAVRHPTQEIRNVARALLYLHYKKLQVVLDD